MKKLWNRFTAGVASAWKRITAFALALLAALGVIVAYSQPVSVSWDHPTLMTNGEPLSLSEIKETRFYCDGDFVQAIEAPANLGQIDLPVGTHECYATTVDIFDAESDPSGTITIEVVRGRPMPPVLHE